MLNLPNFGVVVVDKEGIHNLDTITPEVRITFQKYLKVNVVKQISRRFFYMYFVAGDCQACQRLEVSSFADMYLGAHKKTLVCHIQPWCGQLFQFTKHCVNMDEQIL